jgi:hypothetical protein
VSHDRAAPERLFLPGATRRRGPQALQQPTGRLMTAVAVSLQEGRQPRLAQTRARPGGRGTGQERQRDRTVDRREQADRAGPEPIELGAQLAGQRDPRRDEILPRAAQRPQRLGLIAIGLQDPEAVAVGACQLTQHEPVKPVGLPARRAKPIARCLDLIGMQRQHPHPPRPAAGRPATRRGVRSRPPQRQSTPARHTARSLRPHHARTLPPTAPHQRDPRSARRASLTPSRSQRLPIMTSHASNGSTAPQPGGTVTGAHRQGPHQGLRPVAARGTSPPPGRAGLSLALAQGQTIEALSRRRSRPPQVAL